MTRMRSAWILTRGRGLRLASVLALSLAPAPALPYQQEIDAAAKRLAASLVKAGSKSVAVVDFTDLQGNVTELGRFLAEQLSVALATDADGFDVIDRTHLKTLLQEHKLSASGLIDPQTARKLGQIAGVAALGTGSITPFGEHVQVSIKLLDTQTARLIGAANAEIARTRAIEELLAKGIGTGTPAPADRVAPPSQPQGTSAARDQPAPGPSAPIVETDSYRLVAESVQHRGSTVTVNLVVESLTDRPIRFGIKAGYAGRDIYLLDENGEKWTLQNVEGAQIAVCLGCGPVDLIPQTRLKSRFIFTSPASGSAKLFTLIAKELSPQGERGIVLRGLEPERRGRVF